MIPSAFSSDYLCRSILCSVLMFMAGINVIGAPVKIIFDTDMDSDCDDAGAMAIMHTLANRGELEILATVCSARHKWSAPCIEAINKYYERPDIPIGVPRGRDTGAHIGSKYAETIALKYPGKIKSYDDAPAATEIYRKILAAQPDESVIIVTVGDVTNIRDLLETSPDRFSELTGKALVEKKVKRWVCMGGRYPEHLDPNVFGNFKTDPEATVYAVQNWPGTIWFSGMGENILTGGRLNETPADNPVRIIYKLYLGKTPSRPSWDLLALLFAVRPGEPYWLLKTTGYNHIFPNGTNQWREEPDKDHVLIEIKPGAEKEIQDLLDALML